MLVTLLSLCLLGFTPSSIRGGDRTIVRICWGLVQVLSFHFPSRPSLPRPLTLSLTSLLPILAHGKASLDICEVKENEVVDKVTGISFPIHRSFPYAGKSKDFSLMGAGPRRKNLFVVEVNVYAVGLYVESAHLGKLKGFKGKDADSLSKEKGYYALLTKEKSGMNRALELVFARAVPAGKVVEALSALEGVEEKILTDFKEKLLAAIGTSAGKGETITLAWTVSAREREGRGKTSEDRWDDFGREELLPVNLCFLLYLPIPLSAV